MMSGLLCLGMASAAHSTKLQKEMEDYARDLLRKHPEAAGEKKKRDAREDMVKEARNDRIFELTETQEKNLRRRKDIVTDGEFKTVLKQMKALNSKDPKVTFLIEYAEQDKIKAIEKVLAYRLMKRDYTKAAEKAANERSKRMKTILAKYSDYKAANSKAPESLADLDLPEDCKKFVNSKGEKVDWIYIGHLGPQLKTETSYVVLVEPEPSGGARVCGLDSGDIVRFKNSAVESNINKIVEAMKNGTAKKASDQQQGGGNHPSMGALKSLMGKYMTYKKANEGKAPASLDALDLTADEKQYTSPASGEKMDWIFLGSASKISVGNDVKVVIAAPKASQGVRIIGLSDGRVGTIKDSNIAPHLNK